MHAPAFRAANTWQGFAIVRAPAFPPVPQPCAPRRSPTSGRSFSLEEVAAVVNSTPESVVPMPAVGGAYANCVTSGFGSKASQVTGQDVTELGTKGPSDQRLWREAASH